MTTINGKLIAIDRQELAKAKQQIVDLQQQQERLQRSVASLAQDKDRLAKEIGTCKQIKPNLNTLERQIKTMATTIRSQQMYLISSMLGTIFVFVGGLFWLGNTAKARPAELVDRHKVFPSNKSTPGFGFDSAQPPRIERSRNPVAGYSIYRESSNHPLNLSSKQS